MIRSMMPLLAALRRIASAPAVAALRRIVSAPAAAAAFAAAAIQTVSTTALAAAPAVAAVPAGCPPLPSPVQDRLGQEDQAPDFDYSRLDGAKASLSDHRGKIVVIDFFSTGWLASRNNVVHLEGVYRKYRNRGVVVLGIARDGMENLKAFVEERPGDVTYPVGVAPGADRLFGVGYIPHLIIVDPRGRIFWRGRPEGGPHSLSRYWTRFDLQLADLVEEWPSMHEASAREALAQALDALGKAGTPCALHEGHEALKEVPVQFGDVASVAKEAREALEKLEGERRGALDDAGRAYAEIVKRTEAIKEEVRAAGSLLEREKADARMARLAEAAGEAGANTRLSITLLRFNRDLKESYEGPGFLGVTFEADRAEGGATVERVLAGTAAERWGLKAGDVIVEAAGKEIRTSTDLAAVLSGTRPGEKIALRIRVGGGMKDGKGPSERIVECALGRRVQ